MSQPRVYLLQKRQKEKHTQQTVVRSCSVSSSVQLHAILLCIRVRRTLFTRRGFSLSQSWSSCRHAASWFFFGPIGLHTVQLDWFSSYIIFYTRILCIESHPQTGGYSQHHSRHKCMRLVEQAAFEMAVAAFYNTTITINIISQGIPWLCGHCPGWHELHGLQLGPLGTGLHRDMLDH